ncbi:hypothetical protein [Vibrio coralliilyticus]|uniref:hypothetical protein n=1 Tax=Vibrio coralliilyticus TaxID=190893 RepID=UPI002FCE9449
MKLQLSVPLALMIVFTGFVDANELDFSQFKGKAYKVVKSELLAKGWETLPKQEGEISLSQRYPEITCGSGSMAICSAGFRKKQESVGIIVTDSDIGIMVLEVY